jgi:hypothetical protein
VVRAALGRVAAGGAAHAVVLALAALGLAPLAIALAATLAFAVVAAARGAADWDASRSVIFLTAETLGAVGMALVFALAAPWSADLPTAFYCRGAVPWRIEIALLGAFAFGLLRCLVYRQRLHTLVDVAVHLSLSWIAPFYGFFAPGYMLALGLGVSCPGRTLPGLGLVVIALYSGNRLGALMAAWLWPGPA